MIAALLLGLWLWLSANRPKQVFWEASFFTFIAMVILYLMAWEVPEVGAVWLLSWFLRWLVAFVAFWLMDVLATNAISALLFATLAGVAYFFMDAAAWNLAIDWLGDTP